MMNAQTTNPSGLSRVSSNRTGKQGRTWRRIILVVCGVGLAAALVAGFWPKPVPVQTAPVTRGPFKVTVREDGKTRIRHRYVVSPPVAGHLKRMTLRAGDTIIRGQTPLAVILAQTSEFLSPRTRAQAKERLRTAGALKNQRSAEVERAEAALKLARKEFKRARALFSQDVISRREWDDAQTREQILGRELRAAQFALDAATFEVEQARAVLEKMPSSRPEDSFSLEIISPVNGFVLNVYEENARFIPAGTPIMEIGDPLDLEAEIELLSRDAVAVIPGAEVEIEGWGGPATLRGRVSMVEPGGFTKISALGVEEQRVRVRVNFLNPLPETTRMGDRYRVEAVITTWQGEDILQIPIGALFRRGNRWMVFVFENGRARLREVETDHTNGEAAEIRSGLSENERVILYPPDALEENTAVTADING
jgi:HlyD family secretion protein